MKKLLLLCSLPLFSCLFSVAYSNPDTLTVVELKEKIIDLQNEGELGFRNFTLCSNILGFGQYVPMPAMKVKVGSSLLIYYEPKNVFTNRLNGAYQIWYTQDMILVDADGEVIYEGPELLNFNYQTTSPVLDTYATNSLNLGELPPGEYIFKAIIHDKLKQVDAEHSFKFEIVP